MKKESSYLSADKVTNIHAVCWLPDGEVKGVLQIAHGMVEFIERYERFSVFLNQYGWAVVGNDHLGHGKSVTSEKKYGFFRHPGGNEAVIADMRKLHLIARKQFPDVPYFLLGHSMGSFFTREYIEKFGQELAGAIIMGTGSQPGGLLRVGKGLCRLIASLRGWNQRSLLLDYLAVGSFNKEFEPARTRSDWISRDEAVVDAFLANPLCSFRFTVNGYYSMFTAIEAAQDPGKIARIPKNLPMLLVSGKDDPVGNFGEGVKRAYLAYKRAGISEVQMHLFEKNRHEILNELDHVKVEQFIYDWLEQHI